MRRLTDQAPVWVKHYLDLRFKPRGRDREGVDCWGLVGLVYAERLGIIVPSYADQYEKCTRVDDTARMGSIAETSGDWAKVEPSALELGDAVEISRRGRPAHVGMMVARDRMLHIEWERTPVVERIDGPSWQPRVMGYWRFVGGPRLRAKPSPFRDQVIDRIVEPGQTIAEILASSGLRDDAWVRVHVAGREVPREHWHHVRPRHGRLVSVTMDLGTGGGDSTRIVLMVAIVAISIAAPYAAPAAWGIGAGTFGGALLSTGVLIGGTLLVNALVPPPRPRLSDASLAGRTSNAINGASNQVRRYGPVPVLLGEHRIAPDIGAIPFTETIGDDQYLRMLFVCGYGPLAIDDPKIGETELDNYEGVEIEYRNGYADDPPLTLYPGTVHEDPFSTLLTAGNWIQRTSQNGVDELSIDVTFPQGLATIELDSTYSNRTVEVELQYSDFGAAIWKTVNGNSPVIRRQLDYLFRTPECEFGAKDIHNARIEWGSGMGDAKPGYLPASRYSWAADGWVFAPTAGVYTFGVDGSDAMDVTVAGKNVVDWYSSHNPVGTPSYTHTGTVTLAKGWHRIYCRMESRNANGGAFAVGWQKPGDPGVATIPAGSFAQNGDGTGAGLRYRWFDNSTYDSTLSTTANRLGSLRTSLAFAVPTGHYDVRIRRNTADAVGNNIIDKVYYTALRSLTNENPISLDKPLAKVAIRIRASDQLNGVIDQFNVVCRSILPDWDEPSGTWITRATSSPAACYRAILQGPANRRPVADARLDLSALQAWAEATADKGLFFNGMLDFSGTVFERLRDVAAAGRATFGMRDGKYSIVRDQVQTTPVQHFTPRNSWGFEGRKSFPDIPHALRVGFLNKDKGHEWDERPVYDDGFNEGNATVFETLEVFGVTSTDEAWKHGRYHIAVGRLRPEVFTLRCDVEHLVCSRGDLVLVTHDVPLWGSGYGRVTAVSLNGGGDCTGVDLDDIAPMEAGPTYVIRFRLDTGATIVKTVNTVVGDNRAVVFQTVIPNGQPMPKVGDLWMFGENNVESRELLVKSIEIERDLSAKLTLVDHAPAVHDADTGEIPPYDSGITNPPTYELGPETPVIEQIQSDDMVMLRMPDGTLRARMLITLRKPSGTKPIAVAAQVRTRVKADPPDQTQGPWVTHPLVPISNCDVYVENVEEGVTYQIKLRTLTQAGLASPWVSAEHTIVGKVRPPPDVVTFDVDRLTDGTRRYSWDLGTIPPDIAGVKLRYRWNPDSEVFTWEQLTALHTGVLEGASPTDLPVPAAAGTYSFGIKMVDTSGNESENAVIIIRTLGPGPQDDLAFSADAKELGWPGTKTGCHVSSPDRNLWANSVETWGDLPATWADWNRWTITPVDPIVYTHPVLDLGAEFSYEPQVSAVADGDLLVEFRHSADGVTFSAWTDLLEFSGLSIGSRFCQYRITVEATVADPIPVIRQFSMLIRSETVTEVIADLITNGLSWPFRIDQGDFRAPITKGIFGVIRSVSLSFNGTGQGWTWELIDKAIDPGPRLRMYGPDGSLQDAKVDIVVRGLPGVGGAGSFGAGDITLDFSNRDRSAWMSI